MSQDNDKRELLKLRQGIIDKSESIDESGYDVEMPKTATEKTKNWMWYHTGIIVLSVIILAVGAVIYFNFFRNKNADIEIYSAGNYTTTMIHLLENNLDRYCPDFNSDSKSVVSVSQSVSDEMLGNVDLYEEVNNGDCQVFIGTEKQLRALYEDIMSAKNQELFTDLSGIESADGYLINIKDTAFGKKMQVYSTEMYFAVRKTDDEAQKNAIEFIQNITDGKTYKQDN